MEKYNALLVVEGKSDKDFIASFLACDIITTNGSAVSRETIDFVRKAAEKRDVVVLTDPDAPGKKIRDTLNQNIPGLSNAYVPYDKCQKHHKVGIAESSKEDIMEALSHVIPNKKPFSGSDLKPEDLCSLGLSGAPNSSALRSHLEIIFHLGHTNGKTFLQRCRSLGLAKKDLEKALNG
jgi:ribonuclease M5